MTKSGSHDERRRLLIILGMHRSGTSTLAQALARAGAPMGDRLMREAAPDNAEGYWEDADIVALQQGFLTAVGCPGHDPAAIGADAGRWKTHEAYAPTLAAMVDILRRRFGDRRLFAFKDPRSPALLGLWREASAIVGCELHFTLAIRRPGDVAASLEARNGLAPVVGELLWLRSVRDSLDGLSAGDIAFPYEAWFEQPARMAGAIERLLGGLGLAADPGFSPRRDLRHQTAHGSPLPLMEHVHDLLAGAGPGPLDPARLAKARAAIDGFVAAMGGWSALVMALAPLYQRAGLRAGRLRLPWPGPESANALAPAGIARLRHGNPWTGPRGPGRFGLHANAPGQPAVEIRWSGVRAPVESRLVCEVASPFPDAAPLLLRLSCVSGEASEHCLLLQPGAREIIDIRLPRPADEITDIGLSVALLRGGGARHAIAMLHPLRLVGRPSD